MDMEAIMNQAMEQYRAAMKATLQSALEQQERMKREQGAEVTEQERQELIDDHNRQLEEYEAIMQQQMQPLMGGFGGMMGGLFSEVMEEAAAGMELGAKMAASMVGNGEDVDLSALLEADDEEIRRFIEEHPVPADKEKLLPIGALLLITNGEPYPVFAMQGDKQEWREMIEESWDIEAPEEGKEMLELLLQGFHEKANGNDYRNFKADKPHELADDSVEAYQDTLESLKEDLPILVPYVENCRTLLAWDLERVGYLARIFAHIGWISENEAWGWMEKSAMEIKSAFNSWEEYISSVLAGRAVAMGFDYSVVDAANELLDQENSFLKSHIVSAL